ncbi:hypothetical protein [Rhodococcus sp. SJ-3]|uniref:hypothetical protein n=1 Tax=Rhodococcus sp. SJ-3 TaxID=3454628 RepID=UPI003F793513
MWWTIWPSSWASMIRGVKLYLDRRQTRYGHQDKIIRRYGLIEFADIEGELVAWIADQAWATGDSPNVRTAGAVRVLLPAMMRHIDFAEHSSKWRDPRTSAVGNGVGTGVRRIVHPRRLHRRTGGEPRGVGCGGAVLAGDECRPGAGGFTGARTR